MSPLIEEENEFLTMKSHVLGKPTAVEQQILSSVVAIVNCATNEEVNDTTVQIFYTLLYK